MVAIAHALPRQLSFLEAPAAPSSFDVIRLSWWIRQLRYGDALVSGMFRLERQRFQQIAAVENDEAKDGMLVVSSYAEYLLFISGGVAGVLEVRARGRRRMRQQDALAHYLLAGGWQVAATRLVEAGALASPGMRLDRVKRLLKGDS